MCAPPGGQNDVFIILDQVSRNTTCLPKESFYFFMFRNFRFQFNSFFKKFNFLQFIQMSCSIFIHEIFFIIIKSKPLVKECLFRCLLFGVK